MAAYVSDTTKSHWAIISPTRKARPDSSHSDKHSPQKCPFCPGNEALTPPEIARISYTQVNDPNSTPQHSSLTSQLRSSTPHLSPLSSHLSSPTWLVRVVPNKYPITDIHEVIIHSPDHEKDIAELPKETVTSILSMYQQRLLAHEHDGHTLIFSNHGKEGGASLAHPHSQLVVVPDFVSFSAPSSQPVTNLVKKTEHFTVHCPAYSEWPYEVWITPNQTNPFSQAPLEELNDLSVLLPTSLRALKTIFESTFMASTASHQWCYNYYISDIAPYCIRIIPRFVYRAGFELGTGISVNIIDPKEAAEGLKQYF